MRYVSIDIETTGLDPEYCQIIEFAAVIDDLKKQRPLDELPRFQTYLWHERYTGEPYALSMHSETFKKLSNWKSMKERVCTATSLFPVFHSFLATHGYKVHPLSNTIKINAAGKNFSGFDKNFLDKLPNSHVTFHHRSIDPAILYLDPFDDEMPGTEECFNRACMEQKGAHTALEDALSIIKLVRNRFSDGVSPARLGKNEQTLIDDDDKFVRELHKLV